MPTIGTDIFPPSLEFPVDTTVDVNTTKGDVTAIGKIEAAVLKATDKLTMANDTYIELIKSSGATYVAFGNLQSTSTIPSGTIALIGESSTTDKFLVRAVSLFQNDISIGDSQHLSNFLEVYNESLFYNDVTVGADSSGDAKNFNVYGGAIYLNVDTANSQLVLSDTKS